MSPGITACVETVGVAGLAVLGAVGGRLCSRRARIWPIGYIVPLAFFGVLAVRRWLPQIETLPPFAWIMVGRLEMALLGPACLSVVMTLWPRLPRRNTRVLFAALMALVALLYSILPFLLPAVTWRSFADLKTILPEDGVCLQTYDYTCGPAATVTALHRVGIQAQEGELAILSHTSRVIGTPPDCLCLALQQAYGLDSRLVFFNAVEEMRGREPVIVVTKYSFVCDHFVTVLEVKDATVIIGDPLAGRTEWTIPQFRRMWRRCGIVLERQAGSAP